MTSAVAAVRAALDKQRTCKRKQDQGARLALHGSSVPVPQTADLARLGQTTHPSSLPAAPLLAEQHALLPLRVLYFEVFQTTGRQRYSSTPYACRELWCCTYEAATAVKRKDSFYAVISSFGHHHACSQHSRAVGFLRAHRVT